MTSIRGGKSGVLAQFAEEQGVLTWQDPAFADIWSRPSAPGNIDRMIDRVVAENGRISFNMEGIRSVDEILADEGGGFTAKEFRYICGSASALAITTFYNGKPAC